MRQTDPATLQDIRRALLERGGLLDAGPRPELDRWTAVLRRATGSAAAALAVPVGDRTLITSLWTGEADEPETAELGPGESLEQFLSGRIGAPAWADGLNSYLEDSVVVDGHMLCTLGVADAAPRDWDARDMQILDDATAAIASEIRLRLANDEALRFHELVASQQRVHELIAGGAPLTDVLVELVGGLERHDPSVIPCVVLLGPESNTLHPTWCCWRTGPAWPGSPSSAIARWSS